MSGIFQNKLMIQNIQKIYNDLFDLIFDEDKQGTLFLACEIILWTTAATAASTAININNDCPNDKGVEL